MDRLSWQSRAYVQNGPSNHLSDSPQPYLPQRRPWQTATPYPTSAIDPNLEETTALEDITSDWGRHPLSRVHTKSGRSAATSEELDTQNRRQDDKRPSISYSAHTPKLRIADSTQNFSFRAYPPPATNKVNNSKRSRITSSKHNEVEKKYRTRLNSHFTQLLEKIPAEVVSANGLDATDGKAVSKTETLTMAVHYIKQLEGEASMLSRTNEELLRDFEALRQNFVQEEGILLR
jgi:hypothetical protein